MWRSLLVGLIVAQDSSPVHPWPTSAGVRPLSERILPPRGYARVEVVDGSFAGWLRRLPVKPGRPQVRLHDGSPKANQSAHHVVLDVDVGGKDLQQCADAVMRLRAEYLWAASRGDDVCFRFTSGDPAPWRDFRRGLRPVVRGNRVRWSALAGPDESYATFRRYLEAVFTYAGTHSLAREMGRIEDASKIEGGDVFIQPGFPGHAVLVLDVAEDREGRRVFLLGQSYMPAQEPHVLVNPEGDGPWYEAKGRGTLETPEWRFTWKDLRRFSEKGCPPASR